MIFRLGSGSPPGFRIIIMSADLRPESQHFVFTSSLSLSSRGRSTSLWVGVKPDHQNISVLGVFVRMGDFRGRFFSFCFYLVL